MHVAADLLTGIGGLLAVVGSLAGAIAVSNDAASHRSRDGGTFRAKARAVYRRHPRLVGTQWACFGTALVIWVAVVLIYLMS